MEITNDVLVTTNTNRAQKDARAREKKFVEYLDATGQVWYWPDLERYRDYLLAERHFKPITVAAHIGTLHVRYRELLADESLPATLSALAPPGSDAATFVAHTLEIMRIAASTETARVPLIRTAQITHPPQSQIEALLRQPVIDEPVGLRDLAVIGLILGAGLNETEVCALQVDDVLAEGGERLTLHLTAKGSKAERFVPVYDDLLFETPWIALCLRRLRQMTHRFDGPLLPGFWKTGKRINDKPLTPRGIQKLLKTYPVPDDSGQLITIPTLDLRRTYARRLFLAGIDLATIQANLGQLTSVSTLEYIGPPEVSGVGAYPPFASATIRAHLEERLSSNR